MEIDLKFLDQNYDCVLRYSKDYVGDISEFHLEKFLEVLVLQAMTSNQPVLKDYKKVYQFNRAKLLKISENHFRSVGDLVSAKLWDIVRDLQ